MPDVHPDDEVPEADRLEQREPVVGDETEEGARPPDLGVEVPEADALEQAIEVPYDDEEDRA